MTVANLPSWRQTGETGVSPVRAYHNLAAAAGIMRNEFTQPAPLRTEVRPSRGIHATASKDSARGSDPSAMGPDPMGMPRWK